MKKLQWAVAVAVAVAVVASSWNMRHVKERLMILRNSHLTN